MTGWRRIRTPNSEDGFSIIELLVALIILSVTLAALPGAIQLARDTWRNIVVLDHNTARDGRRDVLQMRLSEAMPIFTATKSGSVMLAFSGTSSTVSFLTALTAGPAGGNLYNLTATMKRIGGRNALILTHTPYRPKAVEEDSAVLRDHVLFDDVTDVAFRYFGRANLTAQPTWHNDWPRTDALPDMVEYVVSSATPPNTRRFVVELRLRKPG